MSLRLSHSDVDTYFVDGVDVVAVFGHAFNVKQRTSLTCIQSGLWAIGTVVDAENCRFPGIASKSVEAKTSGSTWLWSSRILLRIRQTPAGGLRHSE